MSKLDEIRKSSGGSIAESMGGGRAAPPIPGEYRPGPASVPARHQGVRRRADVSDIPVEKIGPDPGQPRKHFDPDALDRLSTSLSARGQLQPIRVRWNPDREQYVVIVGERRYQAAMKAGLATLACVIAEGEIQPDELLAIQLVENAVREDLLPIEQARAYKSLMDAKGWSQVELAAELGIGQPAVAKALATLRLAPEIQDRIDRGELSQSAGSAIAAIDDLEEQVALAAEAIERKMTRDQVVDQVHGRREAAGSRTAGPKAANGKGRGASKAKPKLKTTRSLRPGDGYELIVNRKKGIEPAGLAVALEHVLAQVRAEIAAERGGDAEAS